MIVIDRPKGPASSISYLGKQNIWRIFTPYGPGTRSEVVRTDIKNKSGCEAEIRNILRGEGSW